MESMETIMAVLVGICLSAACGFRIFIPLLAASVAARLGFVELSESFEWMGTWPAVLMFATATVLEVAAYYVPWVDKALDKVAEPAAFVAGTALTAAFLPEMNPMLKWTFAAIAGGGSAEIIQQSTSFLRTISTLSTGGTANHAVSTGELAGSVFTSVVGLLLPGLVFALLVLFVFLVIRRFLRRRRMSQGSGRSMV